MTKKNNPTMKIAAVLVALVLITSCFVGSTFAKYVTNGDLTGSARVAKFGVNVTSNGSMFAKEYDTDTQNIVATIAKSVVSTDKVVAPGTKGDAVSTTLSGTPEVAVKVDYDATGDIVLNDNWKKADGSFYCPLTFKISTYDDGLDETVNEVYSGKDYNSKEAYVAAIESAIKKYSRTYPAGTDLSTVAKHSLAVSWEWPFSTDENDANDTYLGDQAAEGKAATVSIQVTTTVTQID